MQAVLPAMDYKRHYSNLITKQEATPAPVENAFNLPFAEKDAKEIVLPG